MTQTSACATGELIATLFSISIFYVQMGKLPHNPPCEREKERERVTTIIIIIVSNNNKSCVAAFPGTHGDSSTANATPFG